jgi:hypothetical protein
MEANTRRWRDGPRKDIKQTRVAVGREDIPYPDRESRWGCISFTPCNKPEMQYRVPRPIAPRSCPVVSLIHRPSTLSEAAEPPTTSQLPQWPSRLGAPCARPVGHGEEEHLKEAARQAERAHIPNPTVYVEEPCRRRAEERLQRAGRGAERRKSVAYEREGRNETRCDM